MGAGSPTPRPTGGNPPDRSIIYTQGDTFNYGPKPEEERVRLEMERLKALDEERRRQVQQEEQEQKARAELERRYQQVQENAGVSPVNQVARQRPDQEARRRELDAVARARQDEMLAFEREMEAAKQAEERIRKDAAAARATRGAEDDARLQEEAKLRQEQEAIFEERLREAEAQYRAQARTPGRRQTSEDQRQSEMIAEFNYARNQAPGSSRDQAIADFERRYQERQVQPGITVGTSEDGANVLSYQELLNRLKQYQGGMA